METCFCSFLIKNLLAIRFHVRKLIIRSHSLAVLHVFIVRLLVATLHVGTTGKQDGGYTQVQCILGYLNLDYPNPRLSKFTKACTFS